MEREQDKNADVIELGAAAAATRGAWGIYVDEMLMQDKPGLSSD